MIHLVYAEKNLNSPENAKNAIFIEFSQRSNSYFSLSKPLCSSVKNSINVFPVMEELSIKSVWDLNPCVLYLMVQKAKKWFSFRNFSNFELLVLNYS